MGISLGLNKRYSFSVPAKNIVKHSSFQTCSHEVAQKIYSAGEILTRLFLRELNIGIQLFGQKKWSVFHIAELFTLLTPCIYQKNGVKQAASETRHLGLNKQIKSGPSDHLSINPNVHQSLTSIFLQRPIYFPSRLANIKNICCDAQLVSAPLQKFDVRDWWTFGLLVYVRRFDPKILALFA